MNSKVRNAIMGGLLATIAFTSYELFKPVKKFVNPRYEPVMIDNNERKLFNIAVRKPNNYVPSIEMGPNVLHPPEVPYTISHIHDGITNKIMSGVLCENNNIFCYNAPDIDEVLTSMDLFNLSICAGHFNRGYKVDLKPDFAKGPIKLLFEADPDNRIIESTKKDNSLVYEVPLDYLKTLGTNLQTRLDLLVISDELDRRLKLKARELERKRTDIRL